jgi:hypothetical protein
MILFHLLAKGEALEKVHQVELKLSDIALLLNGWKKKLQKD